MSKIIAYAGLSTVLLEKAKGFSLLLAAAAATLLSSSLAQAQSASPQMESPRDRQYEMLGRMQQKAAQDAQNTGFFDYVEGEPEKQPASKVGCEVDRMRASTSVMVTGRVAAAAPCPTKKTATRTSKRKPSPRKRRGS